MKNYEWNVGIRFILSFFFAFSGTIALAQHFSGTPMDQDSGQEKCAANFIEQQQMEKLGIYGSRQYFEHWVEDKKKSINKQPYSYRTQANGVRLIPVVVHVIHNGSPIGEGANIPFSQIEAQIDILNEDYRRLNPDAVNTPDEFLGVAADANLEFVLAKQDPRGLPTNGVNRVAGSKSSYVVDDAAIIGQLASWPPEDYMNIWVVPLQTPLLGFSSFPISELPGLDFPINARETDGVTIDFRVFGEGGNAYSTSEGRTVTHEVGHFLGLRHIWGDGGCEADDYVTDTPNQSQSTNVCLSSPRSTCGSRDMIENFMDYTPDQCMNLFTEGQVERIDVVLNFSPRRSSLVNGRATREPSLSPNNLALEAIVEPRDFVCSEEFSPQVSVLNAGNNNVNSVRGEISLNGQVLESRNFNLNISPGGSAILTFNPISVSSSGSNNFEVEIVLVNGVTDSDISDNRLQSSPRIQPSLSVPYNFSSLDFTTAWTLRNPDNAKTWEQISLPIEGGQQQLIYLNGFDYETPGELDFFISPQINLAETPEAQLVFQLAFSPYADDEFQESLLIGVSTDCGNTFELLEAPYHKTGISLATAEESFDEFFPDSESHFRTELVNLGKYSGNGNIRIAFISVNGFGNNVFIKDIEISSSEEFRYDFEIGGLVSPGPIVDGSQEFETIQIMNTGNLSISEFKVNRMIEGSFEDSFSVENENLLPGESITYSMPNSINGGINQIEYEIEFPNYDQNGGNTSTLLWHFIQDDSTINIPWRKNFEGPDQQPWISINPQHNNDSWEILSLEDGHVVSLVNGENNNTYWLGSPLFDLSGTSQASIVFDRASGGFMAADLAKLSVQVSTDGGISYVELWSRESDQVNTINGSGAVNPNNPGDYLKEFIDLSAYTGEGYENVRIAFKMEYQDNAFNPVYLDNMELFLSANPDPVDPGLNNLLVYPNPATDIFNITFDLPDYDNINIQIINSSGQIVHGMDYPNTLNQTYSFSTQLFSRGVFVIKISGEGFSEIKRLIIQ